MVGSNYTSTYPAAILADGNLRSTVCMTDDHSGGGGMPGGMNNAGPVGMPWWIIGKNGGGIMGPTLGSLAPLLPLRASPDGMRMGAPGMPYGAVG